MKKLLAILLALTVLLSFAACKAGGDKPGTDDDTPAAAGGSESLSVLLSLSYRITFFHRIRDG